MNEQPEMKPREYIDALRTVNFLSIPSVIDFYSNTKRDLPKTEPESITLGSENGITYKLFYGLGFDLDPVKGTHVLQSYEYGDATDDADVAIEIRATGPDVHSPVQYVYHLGHVVAVGAKLSTFYRYGVPNTSYLVCIDIVDRSIWLVMSPYGFRRSYDGGRSSICEDVDTWRDIRAKANGRPSFDVMRLMSWDEFESIALDQGSAPSRPMFSAQAVATAKRIEPEPFPAHASTVVRVVREQLLEKAAEFERKMSASLAQ
ncbi:MAG: hypothetical protein Q9225_007591 [Loekoesia sp. 1 TL-2023]